MIRFFGLCLDEIGMMSREFRRSEEKPSELELLYIAERQVVVADREKSRLSPVAAPLFLLSEAAVAALLGSVP